MKKILTSLLFVSTVFAQEKPATLSFADLDKMIIKTCALQSSQSECELKFKSVRDGISVDTLLSNSVKLPIDSELSIAIAKDPATFASEYYCLALHNGIISPDQIGPDIFPYVVYGLSFSETSAKSYNRWLGTKKSHSCKEKLKTINLTPVVAQKGRKYTVVLNPLTFLENGVGEEFNQIALRNYNHERLLGIFSREKAAKKTSALWKTLTEGEKTQFKKEHAEYNFNDSNTLYKNFFSYTFETAPDKAYEFLKNKKIIPFKEVKKETCTWCLADNKDAMTKVTEMAKMPPADLLAEVEKDRIKVLILSSGRKNPSKLFYWGKVREDKGDLAHISKIEGSMGKTLCKGEKAEAANETTIILASDSPYSTLIHEYLHVLQIRRDSSWCPVSKRLWENDPVAFETRMVRDREWDVRLVLWNLLDTPQMNIEDQIIVAEGLLREGEARVHFDPSARVFLNDHKIAEYLKFKVDNYR